VVVTTAGARTAHGRIALVQEQRFRLTTDDGRSLLLTLAHDASVGQEALCRILESGAPVEVEYAGEPGLASAVARSVRPT
jgi:hypothetical protein